MSNPSVLNAIRENDRLEKLRSFALLDTAPEREFDAIVLLAQRLFEAPIALVSLIDEHRQWFKAKCGLSMSESDRSDAFCAHAILVDDIMVVEDTTLDERFVGNSFVTGEAGIRFYAGVPLRPVAKTFPSDLPGVGTLCILDTRPRSFSVEDRQALRELAQLITSLIEARSAAASLHALSRQLQEHASVLEAQHLQLRQAERMVGIGSWRYDISSERLDWSDQVYVIYGLPRGEMPSVEEGLSFYPPTDRAQLALLLERAEKNAESFDFESDFITADGRYRRVRSMCEVQIVNGQPAALTGVFQDITDRYAREKILQLSADTDALSGLANRACFERYLSSVLTDRSLSDGPICLILLDLDGFKAVHDCFGHAAGDDILRMMADRLRRIAPPMSFLARLGGDEFIMVLTRPRDCASLKGHIISILKNLRHTVEQEGEHRRVSVTVGAAFFDEASTTPAELTHKADLALYEAKRRDRGTGQIFGAADLIRAPLD